MKMALGLNDSRRMRMRMRGSKTHCVLCFWHIQRTHLPTATPLATNLSQLVVMALLPLPCV